LAAQTAAPASADSPAIRNAWIPFSYLAVWAYLLYALGVATPYLRADLHLTDFEAGLHASALAVGVLAAGVSTDWVGGRIGSSRLLDLSAAAVVVALGLIAVAPSLAISLTGALLLGLGGGTLGTEVTVRLAQSGGEGARRMMSQANGMAMIAAALAPVAMGLAAAELHSWRVALLLPMAALLALAALRPRDREAATSLRTPRSPLPGAYWFAWLVAVLGIAVEFSFVYWGSTIVGKRTGISSADATLLASFFVAGMFTGRMAIGRGLGSGGDQRRVLAAGLGVVLAGVSLVWISTVPALSGVGLFLGGLGTAGMWPVSLTLALQTAPKAQLQAAARATLGSGVAVLIVPSGLGLASDAVGVVAAWPITLGFAVTALIVLAITPRVH
jgi:MFS family permease